MAFKLEKHPTKEEIVKTLRSLGYNQFYAEDVWINPDKGYTDYNTIGTYEAFIKETRPELKKQDFFEAVIKLDSSINEGKRLYITGKTYDHKEDLKHYYRAKWDKDKKMWWVRSQWMADNSFHDFCYERNFRFIWEE